MQNIRTKKQSAFFSRFILIISQMKIIPSTIQTLNDLPHQQVHMILNMSFNFENHKTNAKESSKYDFACGALASVLHVTAF